ncbi:expressed unknown protein [Seminavis robusta]|uniref:Glyoxalase-like domain-containing protein n=1 Tax=Seminavis robusta TaxID=568900 RepID=A0A9N8HRF5_9STRA|nr:expressed unknown protein [Seminavis robusta]|eukprot:Sro1561_g282600.1 n/a (273) ;mRNA; f:11392-12311
MGDDAEAAEAQELMNKLGIDYEVEDEDGSDEEMDPEEMAEKWRREVTITPDNCLDQVIIGTSDLDKAVEEFEKMSGVAPCVTTTFRGTGTKSARCAFEECAYVELVGPDEKQEQTDFSKALAALPAGELVACHYAVRLEESKDMEVRKGWSANGMEYDQITMVSKDKGMPWLWDMYFIKGDGLVPFLTDWSTHDSMHASARLPICGSLSGVKVSAPDDHVVHKLLKSPANMDLSTGSPKLEFTIDFKNGSSHTFSSSDPIGISYPEEGGIGS